MAEHVTVRLWLVPGSVLGVTGVAHEGDMALLW